MRIRTGSRLRGDTWWALCELWRGDDQDDTTRSPDREPDQEFSRGPFETEAEALVVVRGPLREVVRKFVEEMKEQGVGITSGQLPEKGEV